MRIAFFTPLSPNRSALADFGEGLALALADWPGVHLDVFINDTYVPDNPVVTQRLNIHSYRRFPVRARDYDVILYSLGDHSGHHGYMLEFIHRYPGIVIFNDLTIHRCILHWAIRRGKLHMYFDELLYAHGVRDAGIAEQILAGQGQDLIMQYPLFERVVDSSRAVIVQNQYARERILASRPDVRITCIPYPHFMPPGFPEFDLSERRQVQRASLGLMDHFVVGWFGIFLSHKHLEECLCAFAHLVHKHPRSHYILGGFARPEYDLDGRIRELGLDRHVTVTGWASPLQFVEKMFALDVGIHLRHPHIGGTPYTPIRMMGLGVCTIVSDIEPLAELPQGACIKISPDDYQEATVSAVLEYLAGQSEFRCALANNGREFVASHHGMDRVAHEYIDFLERTA